MKAGQALVYLASEAMLNDLLSAVRYTYEHTYRQNLPRDWPSVSRVRKPKAFKLDRGMKTWKIDIDLKQNRYMDPRALAAVICGFISGKGQHGAFESYF